MHSLQQVLHALWTLWRPELSMIGNRGGFNHTQARMAKDNALMFATDHPCAHIAAERYA